MEPTPQTHDFQSPDAWCRKVVQRPDGRREECAEPTHSAVHDPRAYLAWRTELEAELAKWRYGEPLSALLADELARVQAERAAQRPDLVHPFVD